MSSLIVLFNLKKDADSGAYETWAKSTDFPVVRGLSSVNSFEVYRSVSLFGSDDAAPYQYVEVIEIADLVTEMELIKHPFRSGIKAQIGVEF